jgi:hypothetical protein
VIGILRFIGILNAAIWLGGGVFFTFGIGRVPFSGPMEELLGNSFDYGSGAIAQLLVTKYFALHVVCGAVALAHLGAEWLYLGRKARRSTLILLLVLFVFGLAGRFWMLPEMRDLHRFMHAPNVAEETRAQKTKAFKLWHASSQILNLFALGGLCVYVWRANNPPDPTRFVSAMQFRG